VTDGIYCHETEIDFMIKSRRPRPEDPFLVANIKPDKSQWVDLEYTLFPC
jgi:hypothetical protein